MLTFLNIAFRNLVQAKRRTLLLGAAIFFVSLLYLLLQGAGQSVNDRLIENATALSSGHVNIAGFFKSRRKAADPIITNRDDLKKLAKATFPGARVIDRHRSWGRIIGPESSLNAGVSGIIFDEEAEFFNTLRLAKESEYLPNGKDVIKGSFNDMKNPNAILLFASQAKKLGVVVGDTVTIVTELAGGQQNTLDLVVGAIASDMGFMSNWNVYISRDAVLKLNHAAPDTTGAIMIYLKNPDDAGVAMEKMRKVLIDKKYDLMEHDPNPFFFKFEKVAGEDWLGQKLDLTIWSDEVSFVSWITSAFSIVTLFIILVLGLIIGGGIGNTMWMSVRERTKEIGTIRAIGAQKNQIALMFIMEAFLIGVIFSGLSAIFGFILVTIVNAMHIPITAEGARLFLMANVLELKIGAKQIISSLFVFGAITALSAVFPALRAARLRPVEALMQGK